MTTEIIVCPMQVAGYDQDDKTLLFTVSESDLGVYEIDLKKKTHDRESWERLSRAIHEAMQMFEVGLC